MSLRGLEGSPGLAGCLALKRVLCLLQTPSGQQTQGADGQAGAAAPGPPLPPASPEERGGGGWMPLRVK